MINPDRSDAKKITAFAISSGLTRRPSGVAFAMASRTGAEAMRGIPCQDKSRRYHIDPDPFSPTSTASFLVIGGMRQRMEAEVSKEDSSYYDIKVGRGGIFDEIVV